MTGYAFSVAVLYRLLLGSYLFWGGGLIFSSPCGRRKQCNENIYFSEINVEHYISRIPGPMGTQIQAYTFELVLRKAAVVRISVGRFGKQKKVLEEEEGSSRPEKLKTTL